MIEKVKAFVRTKLAFESSGHDYLHVLRVYENAKSLLSDQMDSEVVLVTSLIHDLYDHKLDKEEITSKTEIHDFLETLGLTDAQIMHIFSIIDTMSFSTGKIPETLEGKVVQDADRLDALGAIGIARTFAYGGKKGRLIYDPNTKDGTDSVSHFYQKLFLLESLMNTEKGKKLAHQRTLFMKQYIETFYKEVGI